VSGAFHREPNSSSACWGELPATKGLLSVEADEGYERWAPIYDEVPNPLLAREERHLLPALPDVRNKSVLDVACGTGRWLERLMAEGARPGVGVDRSAAMLQIARRKSRIGRCLVEAVCESLPFATACADLAICSFALGHIENLSAMARELARVTKSGADLFISDLHPEAYAKGWRVGFREGTTAIQIRIQPRPVEEIIETFSSHGFECRGQASLWLGEPERPFFARAGKSDVLGEACNIPAVVACRFVRSELSAGVGERDELPAN
jgi:ubiquinone/menaquinone biosynthesis C-methylase UbiE